MGKIVKAVGSIFSGPKVRIPEIKMPETPAAPAAPVAPAPPASEVARVDGPDPDALSNVAQRAAAMAGLVGRRKLKIPLIDAATEGSGLSIPR